MGLIFCAVRDFKTFKIKFVVVKEVVTISIESKFVVNGSCSACGTCLRDFLYKGIFKIKQLLGCITLGTNHFRRRKVFTRNEFLHIKEEGAFCIGVTPYLKIRRLSRRLLRRLLRLRLWLMA